MVRLAFQRLISNLPCYLLLASSLLALSAKCTIHIVCALNGKYSSLKNVPQGLSPEHEGVTSLSEASGKVVYREVCTEARLYSKANPVIHSCGPDGQVSRTAWLVLKNMNWIRGYKVGWVSTSFRSPKSRVTGNNRNSRFSRHWSEGICLTGGDLCNHELVKQRSQQRS